MMFLQFFVWGAWFVTLGTYLNEIGFSGTEIASAYLTNNIGAIIAPFFAGMIADRFFPSQKVAGTMHLFGAGVLYYVTTLQGSGAVVVWLLIYNAAYMSTLALANSISFAQMTDPDQQFPKVRVWGTIGWIVAGLTISLVLAAQVSNVEATNVPMTMAAMFSAVLGLYCFTLPDTPPPGRGRQIKLTEILGVDALALFKHKPFAVFAVSSVLICVPLAFYYSFANLYLNEVGMQGAAGKMTMGQMSEALFLLAMPFFFRRLGVKWMLLVGMLAWVVRYLLFAYGSIDLVGLLYLGILLHGICYDFFFVTGQIYVDRKAGENIRASAQGLITLLTYGAGMAIGTYIAGLIVDAYVTADGHDWQSVWLIPAAFAGAVAVLFSLIFNDASSQPAAGATEQEGYP
jgi:nucleoside transporter